MLTSKKSRSRSSSSSQSDKSNSASLERFGKKERLPGKIVRMNFTRGFGFLELDKDGSDVFFHSNELRDFDFQKLRGNEKCEVKLHKKQTGKNPEASAVWVTERGKSDSAEDEIIYGTVDRLKDSGGYGFLISRGEEIFFHASALRGTGLSIRSMRSGDKVRCTLMKKSTGKNKEAKKVWLNRSRSRSRSPPTRRRSSSLAIEQEMKKLRELITARRRRSRSRSRSPFSPRTQRGTILRINAGRGFGFIGGERDEFFFHTRVLERDLDIRQFRKGDRVEFQLKASKKIRGKQECGKVWPMNKKVYEREQQGERWSNKKIESEKNVKREAF